MCMCVRVCVCANVSCSQNRAHVFCKMCLSPAHKLIASLSCAAAAAAADLFHIPNTLSVGLSLSRSHAQAARITTEIIRSAASVASKRARRMRARPAHYTTTTTTKKTRVSFSCVIRVLVVYRLLCSFCFCILCARFVARGILQQQAQPT